MPMLERFSLLHTADVDEFRVAVGQYLTPHKLAPAGRVATLENDLAMAALGPVTLVYGRNAYAVLQVQLTEQVDYYDVNLALVSTNLVRTGGEEVLLDARTAGILSPRMLASMQLSDGYRQLHVRVERYALERQLEELLGRPVPGPIRFRPGMDLTDPAAASWSQAVQLLVRDLNEPAGLAGDGRRAIVGGLPDDRAVARSAAQLHRRARTTPVRAAAVRPRSSACST